MRIHLLNESKMETFVWSIKKNEDEKKTVKIWVPSRYMLYRKYFF